jgi:hypothetical protein
MRCFAETPCLHGTLSTATIDAALSETREPGVYFSGGSEPYERSARQLSRPGATMSKVRPDRPGEERVVPPKQTYQRLSIAVPKLLTPEDASSRTQS